MSTELAPQQNGAPAPQSFSPFPPSTKGPSNAVAEAEAQRAIAEAQAAMVVAQRFPRDQAAAMERILNACRRPGLAEKAIYAYPRGGETVSGPSIRLAEAIFQGWGNCRSGVRELEQKPGHSIVQSYAWDLETNTYDDKIFTVPHVRETKSRTTRLESARDVYEHVANQAARRKRSCMLAIIPADVVEGAVKECERTMKANVNVTSELIAKLIETFSEFGVTRRMIEKSIQRNMDAITPAQVVRLRSIWNSLKDGVSDVSNFFEIEEAPAAANGSEPQSRADALAEKLAKKTGAFATETVTDDEKAGLDETKAADDRAEVAAAKTQAAAASAESKAAAADDKAKERALRTQILETEFGKLSATARQAVLKRAFAKTSLTDLTVAQLEDVLAHVEELIQGAP